MLWFHAFSNVIGRVFVHRGAGGRNEPGLMRRMELPPPRCEVSESSVGSLNGKCCFAAMVGDRHRYGLYIIL